jgi:hypothetical protein
MRRCQTAPACRRHHQHRIAHRQPGVIQKRQRFAPEPFVRRPDLVGNRLPDRPLPGRLRARTSYSIKTRPVTLFPGSPGTFLLCMQRLFWLGAICLNDSNQETRAIAIGLFPLSCR